MCLCSRDNDSSLHSKWVGVKMVLHVQRQVCKWSILKSPELLKNLYPGPHLPLHTHTPITSKSVGAQASFFRSSLGDYTANMRKLAEAQKQKTAGLVCGYSLCVACNFKS